MAADVVTEVLFEAYPGPVPHALRRLGIDPYETADSIQPYLIVRLEYGSLRGAVLEIPMTFHQVLI